MKGIDCELFQDIWEHNKTDSLLEKQTAEIVKILSYYNELLRFNNSNWVDRITLIEDIENTVTILLYFIEWLISILQSWKISKEKIENDFYKSEFYSSLNELSQKYWIASYDLKYVDVLDQFRNILLGKILMIWTEVTSVIISDLNKLKDIVSQYISNIKGMKQVILQEQHFDRKTRLPNKQKCEYDIKQNTKNLCIFSVRRYDFVRASDWLTSLQEDWLILEISDYLKKVFNLWEDITLYKFDWKIEYAISFWNDEKDEVINFLKSLTFWIKLPWISNTIRFIWWVYINDWIEDDELNIIDRAKKAYNFSEENSPDKRECWNEITFYSTIESQEKLRKLIENAIYLDIKRLEEYCENWNNIELIFEEWIVPFLQPIVWWVNLSRQKLEILVRFLDNWKFYNPWEILSIISKEWYMRIMTKIVLEKTFIIMRNNKYSFSINLSQELIEDEDFFEFLYQKIAQYWIDWRRLTIEVLEDINLPYDSLLERTNVFQRKWIKLSLDDFWKWYSNLDKLFTIEFDYLKLDWEILNELIEDSRKYVFIKSIIETCQRFDITVIAEFVDSIEKLRILRNLWVNLFQWFLFDRALKPTDFIQRTIDGSTHYEIGSNS